MIDKLAAATQELWEERARIRATQIARWLAAARETRGAEFTEEKEKLWIATETVRDLIFRLSL